MEMMTKDEYDAFIAEKFYMPVIVHNNETNTDRYVLLDPNDIRRIDLPTIRNFSRCTYVNLNNPLGGKFSVVYYEKMCKTIWENF